MVSHNLAFLGLGPDPIVEIENWVEEGQKSADPYYNAFTLATVDKDGKPDCRVVLLKGIENGKLLFFTNYESKKGQDLSANNNVCVNFFWPRLNRQIRIHGYCEKISAEKSDDYFQTRPRGSQVNANISPQSHSIPGRSFLEQRAKKFAQDYEGKKIPCPPFWGGHAITVEQVEFWLADEFRLHSRVVYSLENNSWSKHWLAP